MARERERQGMLLGVGVDVLRFGREQPARGAEDSGSGHPASETPLTDSSRGATKQQLWIYTLENLACNYSHVERNRQDLWTSKRVGPKSGGRRHLRSK